MWMCIGMRFIVYFEHGALQRQTIYQNPPLKVVQDQVANYPLQKAILFRGRAHPSQILSAMPFSTADLEPSLKVASIDGFFLPLKVLYIVVN